MSVCARCGTLKLAERPCSSCGGMSNAAAATASFQALSELVAENERLRRQRDQAIEALRNIEQGDIGSHHEAAAFARDALAAIEKDTP